jgi:tripartite-type tricarboxylate transporter receptor subunit TctC
LHCAITAAVGAIGSKRLNALAVTSIRRNGVPPSVPTLAESGLAGFDVVNNHGIVAPA